MATQKVVVEGSSVTASQLKDLFRQIADGSIGGKEMQKFLDHQNPFSFPVIDTDQDPFCPEGLKVKEHRKTGKLEWDPAKINLILEREQEFGLTGNKLRRILSKQPVLNACVLDWLLITSKNHRL